MYIRKLGLLSRARSPVHYIEANIFQLREARVSNSLPTFRCFGVVFEKQVSDDAQEPHPRMNHLARPTARALNKELDGIA